MSLRQQQRRSRKIHYQVYNKGQTFTLGEVGTVASLMQRFGLTAGKIAEAAQRAIKRKGSNTNGA
jgi:hypothetical protein